MATPRNLEVSAVPEELQADPSMASLAPFEAPTFTFAFPLIRQILLNGGINATEEDVVLEQVKLAFDIIKFHCGECE